MDRRALAVAVLVLTAGCSVNVSLDGTTATPAQSRTATVVDVVDGDTVDVRFEDGTTERVRLLGVDTPEVHTEVDPAEYEGVPDTEAGRSCLERWGNRASEFARERLAGKTVTIVTDPVADRRGGYDRLLAYVETNGESFNYALIQHGYARLYDSEFTERDSFAAAEDEAQSDGTGLWACAS
jgi:micrococcal nuclease